ncbi:hypothetical protein OE88DRAFT_1652059 [Heliocybe sulcata]|uniref:Uncharacterized protein n=1 Tax=Heliocybe sulcata TaxID=5364 RepID=A0A5C3NHU2_9AGAM|nr:hypothetical protein OE88DRAFT_1652059 [Heliocybe sulcata]
MRPAVLTAGWLCIALVKHRAFLKARGRHYSNEAQAMKVRCFSICDCFWPIDLSMFQLAAKLMAEEDDDEEAGETDSKADTPSEDVSMEDAAPPVPPIPHLS